MLIAFSSELLCMPDVDRRASAVQRRQDRQLESRGPEVIDVLHGTLLKGKMWHAINTVATLRNICDHVSKDWCDWLHCKIQSHGLRELMAFRQVKQMRLARAALVVHSLRMDSFLFLSDAMPRLCRT